MNHIQRYLLIGVVAGIIDVTPMVIQGLCWYANASAFVFWIAMAVIIPSVNWGLAGWLKGLLVSLLAALPIMILVAKTDTKSLIPISIMTILLGSIIGSITHKQTSPGLQ